MRKFLIVLSAIAAITLSPAAYAGKVEDVQAAIKKTCGKDVSNADALRLVKAAFLSCTPGQKVDADGCEISCLKENSGAVVGG